MAGQTHHHEKVINEGITIRVDALSDSTTIHCLNTIRKEHSKKFN